MFLITEFLLKIMIIINLSTEHFGYTIHVYHGRAWIDPDIHKKTFKDFWPGIFTLAQKEYCKDITWFLFFTIYIAFFI